MEMKPDLPAASLPTIAEAVFHRGLIESLAVDAIAEAEASRRGGNKSFGCVEWKGLQVMGVYVCLDDLLEPSFLIRVGRADSVQLAEFIRERVEGRFNLFPVSVTTEW